MPTTIGALAALTAPARAVIYGWDGGGNNSSWQTAANWRNDTIPPQTGTHDVSIKASSLVGGSPQQTADWDYTSTGSCGTIEVVSNSTYAMTLRKSGSGSFSVSSTVTLTGADSSHKTTLDADAAMTLPGIKVESYVTLDVASGVTVDANGTLALDALNGYTECEKIGSGSLTPDTIDIDVGDGTGENCKLVVTGGAINASGSSPFTDLHGSTSTNLEAALRLAGGALDPGTLRLFGGNSASREAIFEYASGMLTSPDALKMYGFSRVDADASFTVTGDMLVSVESGNTFATEATVDISTGETMTANKVEIGGSQACKLIVGFDLTSGALQTDGTP